MQSGGLSFGKHFSRHRRFESTPLQQAGVVKRGVSGRLKERPATSISGSHPYKEASRCGRRRSRISARFRKSFADPAYATLVTCARGPQGVVLRLTRGVLRTAESAAPCTVRIERDLVGRVGPETTSSSDPRTARKSTLARFRGFGRGARRWMVS